MHALKNDPMDDDAHHQEISLTNGEMGDESPLDETKQAESSKLEQTMME
jgi:hypothetical protein